MKTAMTKYAVAETTRRGRRLEHPDAASGRVLPGVFRDRRRVEAQPQRYIARGFTLVELLVVITIMGMIAAMVIGMSALAARKKQDAVVTAMKTRLMLFIDTYHSKMGFYPPDNGNNATAIPGTPQYEQFTGMNSLIYELTGAANIGTSFMPFDGPPAITGSNFFLAYSRGGIANSLPDEMHVFYQPLPNPKDYVTNYVNGIAFKQLIVPVPLAGTAINAWHYDCSNPNRHNPMTYDLWAEYSAGRDKSGNPITATNGNW
jgi:prepilin-type N-terminal cleavage/methylation domain-containing protein